MHAMYIYNCIHIHIMHYTTCIICVARPRKVRTVLDLPKLLAPNLCEHIEISISFSIVMEIYLFNII